MTVTATRKAPPGRPEGRTAGAATPGAVGRGAVQQPVQADRNPAPPKPVSRRRQVPLTPMRQAAAKSMRKLAASVRESHPDMTVHDHLRDAARTLESGQEEASQRHLRAAMFALTPQSLMRNGLHTDDSHQAARGVMHGVHRHLLLVKDITDVAARNQEAIRRDSGDGAAVPPPRPDPNAGYGPGANAQKPAVRQPPGDQALNAPAKADGGGSDPAAADPVSPQRPGSKQFAYGWDDLARVIELVGPKGYVHGWIYEGGPGLPSVAGHNAKLRAKGITPPTKAHPALTRKPPGAVKPPKAAAPKAAGKAAKAGGGVKAAARPARPPAAAKPPAPAPEAAAIPEAKAPGGLAGGSKGAVPGSHPAGRLTAPANPKAAAKGKPGQAPKVHAAVKAELAARKAARAPGAEPGGNAPAGRPATARSLLSKAPGTDVKKGAAPLLEGRYGDFTVKVDSASRVKSPGRDGVQVDGTVYDKDGKKAGTVTRFLSANRVGDVSVENSHLELSPQYQGHGFATDFYKQTEARLKASGVKTATVHADIDVGGYAWARKGFDWLSPYEGQGKVDDLADWYKKQPGQDPAVKKEIDSLAARAQDPNGAQFPTPYDLSRVGYKPGAATWPGKQFMLGSEWAGVKNL